MIGQILAKSGKDVMTIDDSIDSMIVDVEDLNIGVHRCGILCRGVAHVPLMNLDDFVSLSGRVKVTVRIFMQVLQTMI